MAFSFASMNKKKLFTIDTSDFTEYHNLADLYEDDPEKSWVFHGVYISTKSLFADEVAILAMDDYYLNLPEHLTKDCKQLLDNPAAISAINQGRAGFKVIKYHQKRFNRDCYTIEWCDV